MRAGQRRRLAALAGGSHLNKPAEGRMAVAVHIERRNVPGLAEPPGYMHLATVTDARLVFIAGQVPLDERGQLVGPGDPLAQARQCLRNLVACLSEAGAHPEDAVRTTVYVVRTERASLGQVWRELLESDLGGALRTPATLLGVAALGYEGQLVEIECTAAVPLGTPETGATAQP